MTWTMLALIVGSGSVVAMAWRWRRRDPSTMSSQWLQDRLRETRVAYDGPPLRFPVRKLLNESALYNTAKLRKQA